MEGCIVHNINLYISNILHNLETGYYHMRCWDVNAISEMISLIMVLVIVTGSITAVMTWGAPYMEEQKIAGRWESALLQLNVMGGIIEDVLSGGINSSRRMNFQTSEGRFNYDENGGRFVIYYSVYTDYNLRDLPDSYYEKSRFDFDVEFKEEQNSFQITVNNADEKHLSGDEINLEFTATRLDGSITDSSDPPNIILGDKTAIGFNFELLSDAVRIDIACRDPVNALHDYGRIWLFDVGTFVYEAVRRSKDHRVIIENGAVITAHKDKGNMYNEPLYWSQELLDGNSMMNMRIIQMKENKDIGINVSGSGGFTTEAIITSNNSTAQVNRYPISYPLRMRIYGDDAAVYAWNSYYSSNVGFKEVDGVNDNLPTLEIDIEVIKEEEDVKNLWFSLNHAIYLIGMEVKK